MKKLFQVWYQPYGLIGESDYIEGEFESRKDAYEFGCAMGYVEEIIEP